MTRLLRYALLPFGVLVAAAAIGTFFIGRAHVSAGSASGASSGFRLTSSNTPTGSGLAVGRTLFEENCSSCHGVLANGKGGVGPNLQGVGSAAVDLWLSTGWMPLKAPTLQPVNKPPSFPPNEIRDIAEWVASLKPGGYAIPTNLDLSGTAESTGFSLFALNCAPCHTITGAGDALANGYHAPPLHGLTKAEILEAIRTGPQNMPVFSPGILPRVQALDVVAYVSREIEHPSDVGGIGLGGVGPVAEGFVGLFIGVGACLLAAYWVGDRTVDDEPGEDHGEGEGGDDAGPPGAGGPESGDGRSAETIAPVG